MKSMKKPKAPKFQQKIGKPLVSKAPRKAGPRRPY